MGSNQSIKKVNFEDIKNQTNSILINTLPINEQSCLIIRTIPIKKEEKIINDNIQKKEINIIIYGKNANDESIYKKYKQLLTLGFVNIFIYPGGLFEWLCLQDIYGSSEFQTIGKELDILKYRAKSFFT